MQGIYTSQADLWSIGVCTYMMLADGQKPFEATTPKRLVARVLLGNYNFDDKVWEGVSDKPKEFIKELLVVNPQNRTSADQALCHSWLTNASSQHGFSVPPDEEFVQRVRESILNYADQGEFRKLALNVIAKKSTPKEIFEIRKVFDKVSMELGAVAALLLWLRTQAAAAMFDVTCTNRIRAHLVNSPTPNHSNQV
jgi:calcium-dependent protein kinase